MLENMKHSYDILRKYTEKKKKKYIYIYIYIKKGIERKSKMTEHKKRWLLHLFQLYVL